MNTGLSISSISNSNLIQVPASTLFNSILTTNSLTNPPRSVGIYSRSTATPSPTQQVSVSSDPVIHHDSQYNRHKITKEPNLVKRFDIWRNDDTTNYNMPACNTLILSGGVLIYDGTIIDLNNGEISTYSPSSTVPTPTQTPESFPSATAPNAAVTAYGEQTYGNKNKRSSRPTDSTTIDIPPAAGAAATDADTGSNDDSSISKLPSRYLIQSNLNKKTQITPPMEATYTPICMNQRPVAGYLPDVKGLNKQRVPDYKHLDPRHIPNLVETQHEDWQAWTNSDGAFSTSLFPLIYSMAGSTALSVVITFLSLVFHQRKRSYLYFLSLILSTIYLIVVSSTTFGFLQEQYKMGYIDGTDLRHHLRTDSTINALNLSFNTVLYLSMVQVAMLLFSRKREKRMVFWIGISLTVVAQTIWGMSVFHHELLESALPAFAYLFQIAITLMFLACVCYYGITHRRSTLDPCVAPLTFLTLMATTGSIVLFIFDLADFWITEWSDSVSWISTVLSFVTVWEWYERTELLERHREKNGILGRQIFEDEARFGPDSIVTKTSYTDDKHRDDDDSKGHGDNDGNVIIDSQNVHRDSGTTAHSSDQSGNDDLFSPNPAESQHVSFARNSRNEVHHNNHSTGNNNNTSETQTDPQTVFISQQRSNLLDSPFDEEGATRFQKFYHKALDPFISFSDFLINLGLAVSRPLSTASQVSVENSANITNNNTNTSANDEENTANMVPSSVATGPQTQTQQLQTHSPTPPSVTDVCNQNNSDPLFSTDDLSEGQRHQQLLIIQKQHQKQLLKLSRQHHRQQLHRQHVQQQQQNSQYNGDPVVTTTTEPFVIDPNFDRSFSSSHHIDPVDPMLQKFVHTRRTNRKQPETNNDRSPPQSPNNE